MAFLCQIHSGARVYRGGKPAAPFAVMNFYEKLARKIDQSMKAHPRSAMAMDMQSFEIIARGPNFKSLRGKLPAAQKNLSTVIFQKPSAKAAWIL